MYNLSIWGCTHTAREAYSLCTRKAQVWLCSWENLIRKTSHLMSYLYFESCPSQELPQAPRLAFSCNNVFLRAIDLVLVLKLNLYQIILLEKPAVEGACPTIKTRKDAGKHSLKVGPPMAPVQSICWIFVFDKTHFLPTKKRQKPTMRGKQSNLTLPICHWDRPQSISCQKVCRISVWPPSFGLGQKPPKIKPSSEF